MNKAISAGIGVGIGLIALAFILSSPGETDLASDESSMGVELSDEIEIVSEESKSFEVDISEGVELGDGTP
ncbi:MAG: hypothetical protein MK035_07275 [Dehalococcoidia bacterium]|nr:hypothetical protein [Dehalococcoidia bacterium]